MGTKFMLEIFQGKFIILLGQFLDLQSEILLQAYAWKWDYTDRTSSLSSENLF